MGLGLAPGHPQYSASGTSKFIPEIWSGKLLVKFYDATVLAAISNTDYEGEIKDQGDKVYIRTRGTVTINDYVKGQKLNYERIESPAIELVIDKGKYWAFTCDDVDAYQSDIELMSQWAEDATEQLKIVIDTQVLAGIKTDIVAANKGTACGRISAAFNMGTSSAPVQLTKDNIIDYIVDAGTVLDEQNIPETSRFMIIPAWVAGLIKKSELKDASLTNDNKSILRNGRIGVIDRMELYASNLLPYTIGDLAYDIFYGHPLALTFASQFTKSETLRAESTFGDLVRGLQVYGFKVLKGEALGCIYGKR